MPAILLAGACSAPAHSPPSTTRTTVSAGQVIHVDPGNIRRMRGSFPAGYEVSDVEGAASPVKYWGLPSGWSSDPQQCAALADPANGSSAPVGLSGSGSGGIIYVVVAASPSARGPDPGVVDACRHWSMDSGRTTAVVDLFDPAGIEGVPTVGMVAAVRTIVEGSNETDVRATTATAYLGEYVVFVTVVTDPGSGPPQLPPDLASTFLAQAVATLRG
ncbi:MAG TPA: DUF5642 family protein [Mycobacterium sp.]|nr:DUF5642 family protein [Mycobacterium sp.]